MTRVAFFVSPHGFGHAARACAVMTEIQKLRPDVGFDILTDVPKWFFAESVSGDFTHHPFASDVGLVQLSPLNEDLESTVSLLDAAWSDPTRVAGLARRILSLGASVVIADISPLGIAAGSLAALPTVLVENFTWDWIYREYPDAPSGLRHHGRRLAEIFATVDLRVQTRPVCQLMEHAVAVPPVARAPEQDVAKTRQNLGIPPDDRMILVSMGGVRWDYGRLQISDRDDGPWIVVPGGAERGSHRRGRLLLLPFHTEFYHPDLVAASDVVISKLGYSTVAESFCAGTSLAYVERPRFPESPVLAAWVEENMIARCISENSLVDGSLLSLVDDLVADRGRNPLSPSGAQLAAEAIVDQFPSVFD